MTLLGVILVIKSIILVVRSPGWRKGLELTTQAISILVLVVMVRREPTLLPYPRVRGCQVSKRWLR
jgi:hypothetical protein